MLGSRISVEAPFRESDSQRESGKAASAKNWKLKHCLSAFTIYIYQPGGSICKFFGCFCGLLMVALNAVADLFPGKNDPC